jgi:Cu-Zn family superoxide dismutase
MRKPVIVAAVFAVPVIALSACDAPEQPATSPGTNPPVWTGSPSPSAPAGESEGGHGGGGEEASGEKLTAQLKLADGTAVATADIEFAGGFANSVAPTGGAPADFNSAGGHFQKAGHSGHPASGDLTSLQVRADGTAKLVTTTDAFTAEDLLGGAKTAIIIH